MNEPWSHGPLRPGPARPLPYGAEPVAGGVRFSLPAPLAQAVDLLLFHPGEYEPFAELAFPEAHRVGGVWAMTVTGRLPAEFDYGYRVHRPGAAGEPPILSDPYARAYRGRGEWGKLADATDPYRYRARLSREAFDWQGDRAPRIPARDLVIYELHVRGYTQHESAGVQHPGTYAGLIEKIPHLQRLGVNCVELLPIFEFDESDNPHSDPAAGRLLVNYWGYNTFGYFAPKASYAADPDHPAAEFKRLVRALHAAGIEVVLDVVFNHTAEGGPGGPTISFRGLDEGAYYLLDEHGTPVNLTAAGNTVACNSPAARSFILECLRFWVAEFHVDGFRFDEASILARGRDGVPLADPPVLAEIAADPVLRDVRLIAEAWDPGGLDLTGRFGSDRRWSEWNPRHRDALRRFLRGDPHSAGELATRLAGSADLYAERGPCASVNYLTAHDGFTLHDLVSYDRKHNEANGEENRDGAVDELSWNCGAEGPTDDPEILALRQRQMRNALLLLLAGHGIPMLTAGDELDNSQAGNNNAYCTDGEQTWLDWTPTEHNTDLLEFTRRSIAFRAAHPALRRATHADGGSRGGLPPELSWHGVEPWQCDWHSPRPLLAAMLCEHDEQGGSDVVYLAANSGAEAVDLRPPAAPAGLQWAEAADTAAPSAAFRTPGTERRLGVAPAVRLATHAAVLLVLVPGGDSGSEDESEGVS